MGRLSPASRVTRRRHGRRTIEPASDAPYASRSGSFARWPKWLLMAPFVSSNVPSALFLVLSCSLQWLLGNATSTNDLRDTTTVERGVKCDFGARCVVHELRGRQRDAPFALAAGGLREPTWDRRP